MENGYFVRPVPRERTLVGLDLSAVKSRKNADGVKDLALGDLEAAIAKCAAFVVDAINVEGHDRRRRMTYTPGVASAHAIAALLNEIAPGSAVSTDANTPQREREEQLRAFDAGEIRDVVNCGIYLYGLDVPKCDMITIARPTENTGLYQQMVGRGGRPVPGIGELATREERLAAIAASSKPSFLLLDLTGEAGKHSLCSAVDLDDEASAAVKARARDAIRKDPGVNVYDALKDAKAWERGENKRIAEEARRMKVLSAGGPFDPFKAAGIGDRDAYNRYGNKMPGPATEAQLWRLRKEGVPAAKLVNMSKGEASKLITQAIEWETNHRALMSQRHKLAAKGLPHDLSRQQANDMLWECSRSRTGIPSRDVVERIVLGGREVGADDV
jgi:superfamily II DNA/RNA helicase